MSNVNWNIILSKAVADQDMDSVVDAVKHGADVNCSNGAGCPLLITAVIQYDYYMVQYLLEHKVDSEKHPIGTKTTAMRIAASRGYIDIIDLLLEHGADIEAKIAPSLLDRPLWDAAIAEQPETVTYLLEHGAKYEDNILEVMDKYKPIPDVIEAFRTFFDVEAEKEKQKQFSLRRDKQQRQQQSFRKYIHKR